MKRLALAGAALLALSGCTAVQGGIGSVGSTICANADSVRLGWLLVLQNAVLVADPVIQQSMIGAAQAGLASLDACPPR